MAVWPRLEPNEIEVTEKFLTIDPGNKSEEDHKRKAYQLAQSEMIRNSISNICNVDEVKNFLIAYTMLMPLSTDPVLNMSVPKSNFKSLDEIEEALNIVRGNLREIDDDLAEIT